MEYINDVIRNELLNYVPLNPIPLILSKVWDLSKSIRTKNIIEITY
ncbi:hypothetical protein G9F71_020875 [Clostridium sp. FP2]|nr:hypothetical protein [Clostridium sp. FP2]MBZ9625282.1 hypothetical protein [Clostridium sp. FP2]